VGAAFSVLVIGLVLILTLSGGDEAAAGEVFLEPATSTGQDPFTADVSQGPPTVGAAATPAPGPAPGGGIRSASGSTPGLYGGTQSNSSCNRNQMIEFLRQNADKARAWVEALNADTSVRWSGGTRIPVEQIGTYINELTPAILRGDTRVTNHGFTGGRANPLQQVLQAGTAVLIDRFGVPRSRCACGNPLTMPRAASGRVTYRGPQWPGFSPGTIVVVQPSTTIINDFTFIDVNTGNRFARPPGTAGGSDRGRTPPTSPTPPPSPAAPTSPAAPPSPTLTVPPDIVLGQGDVQVTVLWGGTADLDLHVIDPNGEEIYFGRRTSGSGGQLDHDDTAGEPGTHVENIYWPTGGAPGGSYEAWVKNFSSSVTESFELRITVGGQVVYSQGGTLAPGAESEHVPFSR
jgi:hypothetical protein